MRSAWRSSAKVGRGSVCLDVGEGRLRMTSFIYRDVFEGAGGGHEGGCIVRLSGAL